MKELQILSSDGQSRLVPLEGEGVSLGRSSAADLCYASDNALSKKHLSIEKDGDGWAIRDLGSKNGTMLNGEKINERMPLKSGDRITAGHLIIVYDGSKGSRAAKPVVIFDTQDDSEANTSSGTVITQLEGFKGDKSVDTAAESLAASHVSALIRAGNELSGHRPLPELFRFILELSIQAVKADRGVH